MVFADCWYHFGINQLFWLRHKMFTKGIIHIDADDECWRNIEFSENATEYHHGQALPDSAAWKAASCFPPHIKGHQMPQNNNHVDYLSTWEM